MEAARTAVAQRPSSFRSLLTQRRRVTTIVVATVITLVAAAPLAWIAWDARDDEPASAEGLVAVVAGDAVSLSGLDIEPGNLEQLVVEDESFTTIAWAIYEAEGELITDGEAIGGAPFVIGGLEDLDDGVYDLLVSATVRDGSTEQRAARFRLGDGT